MYRLLLISLIIFGSFSSFASSPMDHLVTVKERLRIHLWTEGIAPVSKGNKAPRATLPEEIERPLRKL